MKQVRTSPGRRMIRVGTAVAQLVHPYLPDELVLGDLGSRTAKHLERIALALEPDGPLERPVAGTDEQHPLERSCRRLRAGELRHPAVDRVLTPLPPGQVELQQQPAVPADRRTEDGIADLDQVAVQDLISGAVVG